MQLMMKRSQREAGLLSKTMVFCLDARISLTAQEKADIQRYKIGGQFIYSSEAAKQRFAAGRAVSDGSVTGSLKAIAQYTLARMNLNITINSIQQGQHIECKDLDELLGAEEALMVACQNLRSYLDTVSTFDGREMLFDFSTPEPTLLAHG